MAGQNFRRRVPPENSRCARVSSTNLQLPEWQQQIARPLVADVRSRLSYLVDVGVGYLAIDRPLRTLSGGEAQRVALTTTLGSNLVDMLYVLDEPSVGLHPADVGPLAAAIEKLHERGNTVVVVEHEEEIIRRADHVVEFGPGAGGDGGRITFQGTPKELDTLEREPHGQLALWPKRHRQRRGRDARLRKVGSSFAALAATICRMSPSNFRWVCFAW